MAYIALTHLSNRETNLTLLSHYGKNAHLVGNDQLEQMLKEVETELVRTKEEVEVVNRERKAGQLGAKEEIERLERRYREGVGRVLEVEVAAEGVRREILAARRGQ